MLGRRDPQKSFFSAPSALGDASLAQLGFYGQLARRGHQLFREEDFADAYCTNNGRPSTPPSMLAVSRLLQHYEGISDAEVIARCRFDLRWKVALELDPLSIDAPFAKSTFQAFRVRLTLHVKEGLAFEKSVLAAKDEGLLPQRLRVALDSSPVRGRGAVKDTFNLISDAIAAVVRAAAKSTQQSATDVAQQVGLERHVDSPSIKGTENVDWENAAAVSTFLDGLLKDADRAVALAEELGTASDEADLLRKVITQDVESAPGDGGPRVRKGVTPDRTVSVQDPEMRHGHKSNGKVYSGHKMHIAVETSHGVITAVDITVPAAGDGTQVGSLIEQTEKLTSSEVDGAVGDTAYSTRTALGQAEEAGVELVTKMASPPKGQHGPAAFQVSEDGQTATCPAGFSSVKHARSGDGVVHFWSPDTCTTCPLKGACTKAVKRSLSVLPDFHERRRRERYAHSPEGRAVLRTRMAVEHAIGRIKNRGAGVSSYFGRAKTKAALLWTAAAVNLSLVWGKELATEAAQA